MGRLLTFILGVLGLSAVLYVGFIFLASRVVVGKLPLIYSMNDYMIPRFKESSWWQYQDFNPRKKWDVIILGSSHAYTGYDPSAFIEKGYATFNLGTSAQTPLNSYCIAKHLLDSAYTPFVILDLFDVMFITSGLESTMDLIQNLDNDQLVVDMAVSSGDPRALNMLALRYIQPHGTPPARPVHYDGHGFNPHQDSIVFQPRKRAQVRVYSPSQKHAFESLVALCLKRNIQLVLCSYQKRDAFGTSFHDRFRSYVDSVITGTGIPYIDLYNSTLLKDPEHFSNGTHLNAAGARIFSLHLVDTMETMGLLKRKER